MQDVMIDIETMALHPNNALILSIGLLRFDPTGPKLKLGDSCVLRLPIIEQLLLGRSVEPSTQEFWADQPKEAQDDWRLGPRDTLEEAAAKMTNFFATAKRIWANGIIFDLGNVASLMRQAGLKEEPWHYRKPRDMRTFCEFSPLRVDDVDLDPKMLGSDERPHMAMYDCIVQAHRIWQRWPKWDVGSER